MKTDAVPQTVANPSTDTNKWLPWIVCLSSGLFFFYEFIQMQMFNSLGEDLMRDFALNATQLGYLSMTYLVADVLFLFPAGLLLDRFSTRTIIITALILASVSTFLFAASDSIMVVGFCHFLAGIGNAFCFLSSIRLASRWFQPKQMALVIGVIVTLAMLGGMAAQTPLALLNKAIGWRQTLFWIAVLGVIILLAVIKYIRDYPPSYKEHHKAQQEQLQSMGLVKGILLALRNQQNWLCGIYTSFLNLPIMILGAIFGNAYLVHVEKISSLDASYIISMIFVGTIFGGPILGRLSDQLNQRRKPMLVCGVLSLIVILIIALVHNLGFWPLMILFFALGFFTAAQILSYPMIAESNPKLLTSSSTGLASVLIMGGGAISQPLFGKIMDLNWQGSMLNGTRVYPAEAYSLAIWMIPIAFIIAIALCFFIKETHCKALD